MDRPSASDLSARRGAYPGARRRAARRDGERAGQPRDLRAISNREALGGDLLATLREALAGRCDASPRGLRELVDEDANSGRWLDGYEAVTRLWRPPRAVRVHP